MRARIFARCLRTVLTEVTSVPAISALLCPCATRSRTCHSLGVSRGALDRRRLASPVGLLEVRPEQDLRPEQWMSPSRRYLTPPAGRRPAIEDALADGPASQNPNSSAWRVRHRPCAHRRAVQRVLADRGRSGMPRRTRNSPATNRADRVGLPDDPSARSGGKSAFRRMVARPVAGRTGSARPLAERAGAKSGEGAVLIPAARCAIGVNGQRKGRVLYTHPYLLYTHPYLLDRLDRLLPSASTTCSRQRGGPGSSGGSRWPL